MVYSLIPPVASARGLQNTPPLPRGDFDWAPEAPPLSAANNYRYKPLPGYDRATWAALKPWERAKITGHQRRQNWINENGPCVSCGSWYFLTIDHIDPSTKDRRLKGHGNAKRLWHLNKKDRLVELAKCQVLCKTCHDAKSGSEAAARRKDTCKRGHPKKNGYCATCRAERWRTTHV